MQLVSPILICWIVVYLVDSAIQYFNNQVQINPYPVDSAILVSLILIHWIEGYPVDSAIQLLNSWAQYSLDSFIDLLNNSDQVLTKYQVSVQWVLKLFLQNKPASSGCVPLSRQPLPSLPLGACLYTKMWHASDKGSCMSQKHAWFWTLRVSIGYNCGLIEEQKV